MLTQTRVRVTLILLILLTGLSVAYAQTPGSAGLGDPYFPLLGNGGYDVQHYDISIDVDVKDSTFKATTTITAKATQALSAFNLDFNAAQLDSVEVDDQPAQSSRSGGELTLTPSAPLKDGSAFDVMAAYEGATQAR